MVSFISRIDLVWEHRVNGFGKQGVEGLPEAVYSTRTSAPRATSNLPICRDSVSNTNTGEVPRITYIDTGFRCGVMPCDRRGLITRFHSRDVCIATHRAVRPLSLVFLTLAPAPRSSRTMSSCPALAAGACAGVRKMPGRTRAACGLNMRCGGASSRRCPGRRLRPSDRGGTERSRGSQRWRPSGGQCAHPVRNELSALRGLGDDR